MQQWQYKTVDTGTKAIGWGHKKLDRLNEDLPLDPDVDWFHASWEDYKDFRFADVAWSDAG